MNRNPLIRGLLVSILAGLVVASAGLASAGRLGFLRASAEKPTIGQDSTTCAPDEGTPDDQVTSRDDRPAKECEDPAEYDQTTAPGEDDGTTQPGPPTDREAECKAAAGMATLVDGQGGSDGTTVTVTQGSVKKTGLDHAIEVVLANCLKNPQARGLVNALRHLVANRDRHLAHKAEKAERRAAREAAKAGRNGTKGRGHSKGSE